MEPFEPRGMAQSGEPSEVGGGAGRLEGGSFAIFVFFRLLFFLPCFFNVFLCVFFNSFFLAVFFAVFFFFFFFIYIYKDWLKICFFLKGGRFNCCFFVLPKLVV